MTQYATDEFLRLIEGDRWIDAQLALDLNVVSGPLAEGMRDKIRSGLIAYHRARGELNFQRQKWERAYSHYSSLGSLSALQDEEKRKFSEAEEGLKLVTERIDQASFLPIFITGCGRSGTWLLASMFNCFEDTYSEISKEVDFDEFLSISRTETCLVAKRTHDAYQRFALIPDRIRQVHIIRHPLDVLCSQQFTSDRHISPLRWCGETLAFEEQARRRDLVVVRYEDLVSRPNQVQKTLAKHLDLKIARPFAEFHLGKVPESWTVTESMHGVRAPNKASIAAWKANTANLRYVLEVWPMIAELAKPFCERYDYELPDMEWIKSKLGEAEKMNSDQDTSQHEEPSAQDPSVNLKFSTSNGLTEILISVAGLPEIQGWDFIRKARVLLDSIKKPPQ